jgi:hypothetical protein
MMVVNILTELAGNDKQSRWHVWMRDVGVRSNRNLYGPFTVACQRLDGI